MKKLLLFALLVLSFNLIAQDRMEFLGIYFSNSSKEFQKQLEEIGFEYTGDYYYTGEFMGYIRLVDFIPSCIEDEIYKLTLTCTHFNSEKAIEDYNRIKNELTYKNSYWDVSYCYCIIYLNSGEIDLIIENNKVIIEFIDKISEERILKQK